MHILHIDFISSVGTQIILQLMKFISLENSTKFSPQLMSIWLIYSYWHQFIVHVHTHSITLSHLIISDLVHLFFASFLTLGPPLHVLHFLWKNPREKDFVNVILHEMHVIFVTYTEPRLHWRDRNFKMISLCKTRNALSSFMK